MPKLVGRVSKTDLPVFISGDSGTGKEVVAKAIHQRSGRSEGRFVTVNCGAIPVELIESELFGHAKGSFTGADRERAGLWEAADGGTIFLDEITETGPLFQVKLLRALQEREIRRVGSNTNLEVDVRVIAATNRDIEKEVLDGRFRQDLMYRLNVVSIELPPLRERPEDIPLLTEYFMKKVGADDKKISPDAQSLLLNYRWDGNIRELENAILRAVSLSDDIIYPVHLPKKVQAYLSSERSLNGTNIRSASDNETESDRVMTLADVETKYVLSVLKRTNGNKQQAARLLDIDRKTLCRIADRVPDSPL